jgi:hypothetical protein
MIFGAISLKRRAIGNGRRSGESERLGDCRILLESDHP